MFKKSCLGRFIFTCILVVFVLYETHLSGNLRANKRPFNCRDAELLHGGKLLSFSGSGRLGNKMFRYAVTYAISRQNNRFLVQPASHGELHDIFQLDWHCLLVDNQHANGTGWTHVYAEKYATFYPHLLDDLPVTSNVHLHGYLQSWKYFVRYTDDIKRQFRFQSRITDTATAFLARHTTCSNLSTVFGVCSGDEEQRRLPVHYVGVHVRRGDFTLGPLLDMGFVPADTRYLAAAMTFYCQRFDRSRIVFVVCGEEVSWNLKYVRLPPACVGGRRQHAMVYCWQTNRPAEHMALLAACNHSVVTTGSFGWWAAFLAGGTVVYDKSFPRQNSLLSYHYTHADYYPPHWIPL